MLNIKLSQPLIMKVRKNGSRIINLMNSLVILQIIVTVPNFILSFGGHPTSKVYILNIIIAIFILLGNRSLKKKVKSLEKEKSYRE